MPSSKQKIDGALRRALGTIDRVVSNHDFRLYKAATDLRSKKAEGYDEGIQLAREFIEQVPKDGTMRLIVLLYLGQCLTERYSIQSIDSDREEALLVIREAINSDPQDPFLKVKLDECLIKLPNLRFDKFFDATDLEEALCVCRRCTNPPPDLRYFKKQVHWLHSLARQLTHKASREGTEDTSRESIFMIREALLLEEDEEGRALLLMSLASHSASPTKSQFS
ncbi:hypothetical protein FHL15_010104 [Xylaria flabelliformis]|uniref:Uncharacterized protein n=1 Tax=Xylaria flabelliformis TaxID=2512241 RepID=A0A553HM03_9PEZI|nr:hypothetical protein FHL15_010104 [Xylaria flabelliformis]